MEKSPQLDRAKNGKKWAENGEENGNSLENPFLAAIFCPCPAGGSFPFGFPCVPYFRLLAVFHAMPARHDPKHCRESQWDGGRGWGGKGCPPVHLCTGGRVKIEPFVLFMFFLWQVFAQFEANPFDQATCGLVAFSLVLQEFQLGLGSRNPEFTICPFQTGKRSFQTPKTLRSKRTNGSIFTHVRGFALEGGQTHICMGAVDYRNQGDHVYHLNLS